MWICSTLGYFSIVKKEGDFYVRARTPKDLENLKKAAGINDEVKQFPNTDYVARLIVDKKTLDKIYGALQNTINYPNFKDEIHDSPSQRDKLGYYSKIWEIMYTYQAKLLGKSKGWY